MSGRAPAFIPLFGLFLSLHAAAQEAPRPDPDVAAIRVEFEYGKFSEALTHAQARIDRGGLGDEDLAELHKYAGLAAFNLGEMKTAERHLMALLRLDPDYSLDPFIYPPPAIQYLEKLRKRDAAELEVIRQARREEIARRKRAEEERERARVEAEQQRRRLEEMSRRVTVRTVERRSFLVNFVPFGAGQFQQGRTTLGVVLASTEGALAATSIIGYLAHGSLYTTRSIELDDRLTPSGKYTLTFYGIPPERASEARLWRLVKVISGAAFYLLYGYGVVDALLHHQDEVVTTRVEEQDSPAPASPQGGLQISQRRRSFLEESLAAYVFPLPGGAGAGFRLTF